jgi:hypothetical protein
VDGIGEREGGVDEGEGVVAGVEAVEAASDAERCSIAC